MEISRKDITITKRSDGTYVSIAGQRINGANPEDAEAVKDGTATDAQTERFADQCQQSRIPPIVMEAIFGLRPSEAATPPPVPTQEKKPTPEPLPAITIGELRANIQVRNLGQPPRPTVVFNGITVTGADPDTALAFRDGNTTPEQEEALQKAFEKASIPKPWLDQLFPCVNKASAKPKDKNHAGWNYYATANIIGFKQYPSVPQECPGRDLLIQCVTSPNKTITDTDRATLLQTMEWMVNNTFSGQLDQTIEAAFKIFPADLVQEFLNSDTIKYRQTHPGSAAGAVPKFNTPV